MRARSFLGVGAFRGGDMEHLIDARELDAWTSLALAAVALVAIDLEPALVGNEVGLARSEHLLDRRRVGVPGHERRAGAVAAGGEIGEERIDGPVGGALVRADPARRPALYPPHHVLARSRGSGGRVGDAAAVVGDHPAALVEG